MSATSIDQPIRSQKTRTISITSGKGGVGKTTMVANIATYLGSTGQSVLILDGDLGMANVDIFFGVRCKYTIRDIITGHKKVEEVLHQVAPNVWIIPGGSGFHDLQNLDEAAKRALLTQLGSMTQKFDYMLIDTAPGIDNNVMYFNTSAQEIVVVVTPDPSSITDAYALIKVLHTVYKEKKFSILVNQVRDEQEGYQVFQRLSDVTQKFLYVGLDYAGSVPIDILVRRANRNQQLFIKATPDAPGSLALRKVITKLRHHQNLGHAKGGIQFFWEQLMGVA